MAVEAGAHGRAAQRQLVKPLQGGFEALQAVIKLAHIAAEFLPQRERGGVLQMGAADFDDVVECGRFLLQGVAQRLHIGHQKMFDFDGGGHMNGGGKAVVGGLGLVNVIVGVHRRIAAARLPGQFVGAVGQHFVDIHIRLRA